MIRGRGFVLPIVVLMLTLMALVWSYAPTPLNEQRRESLEHQRYQEILVFWQKAVIAYSFKYGRVPLSASILAFAYDLRLPDGTTGYSDLNINGYGLLQNEFQLDIYGLPEHVLATLSSEYAPYMSLGNFGNLKLAVSTVDNWYFSESFLPREADYNDRFYTDLNFNQHNIIGLLRIGGVIHTDRLELSNYSNFTEVRASSANIERLWADEATVAGQDFDSALRQFEQLEQLMNTCLATGGGCRD
ncbi:hypothetical protein ACQ5ES_11365 [Pseudidiomarina sp. E22-M8]|uniref:hypothetical protein n=1 Tax=Pseudidiomarina sp. E22-M8 TaxID=3424768 RepID=UPI00403D3F34